MGLTDDELVRPVVSSILCSNPSAHTSSLCLLSLARGVAARDGSGLRDSYRRFRELGFTKGARLAIQPSPEGLLNTGKVFDLVVAGVGFEPTTFGL